MAIPDMTPVVSSNLDSIGYDKDNNQLYVTFKKRGDTYIYSGVSPNVFKALKNSAQPGQYFEFAVKHVYSYKKA